jgi:NosR/NirI family nitrous oxide reductase transcriptional regulator
MARRFAPLLFLLLLVPVLSGAKLTDSRRALIQSLFPAATVIEDKLPDVPVYPVYQLQELLGYAYESTDLSRLQGFAGKPIQMMIGLDTQGRFTGVKILHHHEPVFLHGLGEEPLFDFVDQYEGRSLREQIVVQSSLSGKSGKSAEGDVVYFDGVSKATVSVLIVNDTVLSSALKVARQKLEAFAQSAPTRAKPDWFEPLGWQQLIDRGYVSRTRIEVDAVEQQLGRPLSDYPTDLTPPDGEAFTELYLAYMNSPMVGRNLLGDEHYARFMARLGENDQVLMVASRGMFRHVRDSFTPGSSPDRIGLTQNNLSVEMRDLNWLDQNFLLQADGLPGFDAVNLFRVGGNAGFNPGAEASLKLNVELARNHLIADTANFTLPVQFAGDLFETVAIAESPETSREPVWVGLWKERWWQISLLVAGLAVLTVFFARQKTLSRHPTLVHRFRWGFLFFTLFFIGFYAQGQLSVGEHLHPPAGPLGRLHPSMCSCSTRCCSFSGATPS